MRLVYMGTPDFAVPALQALIDDGGHEIVAVYTQPPRPAGRGHKLQESPVHQLATKHGIEVRTPVNFKSEDERQKLRDLNADIGVVAAYGLILPQAVLDSTKYGFLNIHGSVLPRWRGAAPIHRAIVAGDGKTGITIMRMEAGLDTGPMLSVQETEIKSDDTFQTLHDRMAQMGGGMIAEAVAKRCGDPGLVQPEEGVTYAHKIMKGEGDLKGDETPQQIDRMVRALGQWPGVWFERNGHRFKIIEGRINGDAYDIQIVQAPNGKKMSMDDAKRGGWL